MMNIAAVVILYHPDSKVNERMQTYSGEVKKLYIVDNTEGHKKVEKYTPPAGSYVCYLHDGENRGISERLNQVAALAISEGFSWLLTMDQDSYFTGDVFPSYLNCLEKFTDKGSVGMFGVAFEHTSGMKTSCEWKEVSSLITSGSIVNLDLFGAIGGFDESLFIDEVDHEYCLRAVTKGFRIIKFKNILLTHSLGTVSYHRSLKNFKMTPRVLHSPIRCYYILRNYFYIREKYGSAFPKEFREVKRMLLNRLKNNFIYGNKLLLIKYLFKAYRDYKTGRMGKIKLP